MACTFALALTACGGQPRTDSDVRINCTIAPEPPRVGLAMVTIKLADQAAKAVTGARVNLEADMAHPGMAPVFARAIETDPGSYVGQLRLTMAGDWVILVEGVLSDGRKVERQVPLKGVLPG